MVLCEAAAFGGRLLTMVTKVDFPGMPAPQTGVDVAAKLTNDLIDVGVELCFGEATDIRGSVGGWDILVTGSGTLRSGAVVLASGTEPLALGVPGEQRLRGRGVIDCVGCDGPLLVGRRVYIVGDGDEVVEDALSLADHAALVVIVGRSGSAALREATKHLDRVENLEVVEVAEVVEVVGSDVVTGLVCTIADGERLLLDADAIVVSAGRAPRTPSIPDVVARDETGHLVVDHLMRTSVSGLLAAGSLRSMSTGTLLASLADGEIAAITAVGQTDAVSERERMWQGLSTHPRRVAPLYRKGM